MQPVLSVTEVIELEEALDLDGASPALLMASAGASVAEEVARRSVGPVVVLCGMGNNGGDGWVAADELASRGYEVTVVSPKHPAELGTELARTVALGVTEVGLPVFVDPEFKELVKLLNSANVVVDAMIGTGFSGEMREPYATWINALEFSDAEVVSVDVPSGVNAQTGEVAEVAVTADVTLAMLAMTPGLLSSPGNDHVGELLVAPLVELDDYLDNARSFHLEDADLFGVLPPQDPQAHKYSRGTVLIAGGSNRYIGAPVLSALAAARAGAGYVSVATPVSAVSALQTHLVTSPVIGYGAGVDGLSPSSVADLTQFIDRSHALVIGPGMGQGAADKAVANLFLEADLPLVIDAGALTLLAEEASTFESALSSRQAPTVLTPHPGELARLVDVDAGAGLSVLVEAAQDFLASMPNANMMILIKDVTNALVTPEAVYYLPTGPSALATAGTGDVLSGIVGSFLARHPDEPSMVVALAVAVQAEAAMSAQENLGGPGVIASDLIDSIPEALVEVISRSEYSTNEFMSSTEVVH